MDLANDSFDSETEKKMEVIIAKMFDGKSDTSRGIGFEEFKKMFDSYESEFANAKLYLALDGKYFMHFCWLLYESRLEMSKFSIENCSDNARSRRC